MIDLANLPSDFASDPFPYYDRLLAKAPICAQADGSFILSKHADLSAIYKDTAGFISDKRGVFAPKFGENSPLFEHHTTSLVFNDPPLHTRVRSIMSSALAPRALQNMRQPLIETVDRLLDGLSGSVDLIEDFAARIPIQVIGNLLDVPHSERGPLREWSLAILGALEPVLTADELAKGQRAVEDFKTYLTGLIADRRGRPGDPETDVLTRLIMGDATGKLSEIELIQNCIFILNAGHETTTNLIGNGLALLHDHPEQKDRLIHDGALIAPAIEEVLRLRAPNQFGNRVVARPCTLRGVSLPKGANLHLCIGAANRDPEVFDQPETFDITRSPNRHLAFAAGAHVCVGLTLARMEGQIAIQRFLARFPRFSITGAGLGGRVRFHGFQSLRANLEDR